MPQPPIGIDLGTTNSLVARFEAGRPEIIVNRAGERSIPSVVGLDASGRVLVGAAARSQLTVAPSRTVAEIKRRMGQGGSVALGDRSFTPQEISAFILRTLKQEAEAFLGETIRDAVITVPAYFADAQRQATKDAGELAGLRVERIVNEPTAAALAYGLDNLDKEEVVVVYDLGGGTFDVSVLDMFDGVLDVKASAGNNTLGGGDCDRIVAEYLRRTFEENHGVTLEGDARALARLRDAAERAKLALSASEVAVISVPHLALAKGASQSLELELSRAMLEDLVGELLRSTLIPVRSALKDAGFERERVSQVVFVGGASRMPLVRRLVSEFFGREPLVGVNPDEAVALGAAVQAGLKAGAIARQTGIMITDVSPFSLGIEVQSSAGSQSVGGIFSAIIPRNSTIPISRTETYATTADGQKEVTIRVFQGESRFTKHNVFLDEYTIDGVPSAPMGREKVAVTFTYDINGILHVGTKIVSTGREATLVIEKSARRMSPIERIEATARIERELSEGIASGAQSIASPEVLSLLASARERLSSLPGPQQAQVAALLAEADRAIEQMDASTLARVDVELTELLFSLG